MLGAEDYHPKPYSESSEMMEDHQSNLETIIGKRMKGFWVAWDTNIHDWFNDAPVIIAFEGGQIELCAFKSDQFIITSNEMYLSKPIDWYGTDLELSWKKNGLELLFVIGKQVEQLEILQSSEDNGSHAPALYGIGFQLEDRYFAICNGFDQNEIVTNKEELSVNKTVIKENPAKRSS